MNARFLHIPPDGKPDFVQREVLAKELSSRIQERADALLKQGEKIEVFSRFMDSVSGISEPFPIPKPEEITALNTHIQAGEITLQARVNGPTPVFYTGNLRNIFGGATGTELLLDENHQVDPLETVALSGATFHIIGVSLDHEHVIYQVTTPDYPYATEKGYYIDARFVDAFWMPLAVLPHRERASFKRSYS